MFKSSLPTHMDMALQTSIMQILSFPQSTTNAGEKKPKQLKTASELWPGLETSAYVEEKEWDVGRAGAVTCRVEFSMPALPLAHSHVLLMLSITGISANDPRLFTEVEYFSCGLVSYTAPRNHFTNGYREGSEAGGVAPQSDQHRLP